MVNLNLVSNLSQEQPKRIEVNSDPNLALLQIRSTATGPQCPHTLTMRVLAAVNKPYSYLSQHGAALFLK